MPRVLGPTVLSLGGKLVDALGLFDVLPPMANLMLSSVPGPPIPLWLSGHRVVSAAPVGPLLGPISLNVTVLGFEQNLEFGMLGCAKTMPDLATLRDYLLRGGVDTDWNRRRMIRGRFHSAPRLLLGDHADVAQLVERDLAKVEVAGSSPVVRSR